MWGIVGCGLGQADGYWRTMPKIQDNSTTMNTTFQISNDGSNIKVLGRDGNSTSFTDCYITVQYTKTITPTPTNS